TVDLHREVQVGPAGETCCTGQAQWLSHFDMLADPHQYSTGLEVGVQRHGAVVVQHPDEVGTASQSGPIQTAVFETRFRLHHDAGPSGQHRRTTGNGEI